MLPLLIALGFWQLSRAEEKRHLLAAFEARREAAPQPVAVLPQMNDPAYVRVRLQGRFDAEHTLLLDNRTRNGKAGVEVLQPFHDQASGLWLLVNRGWVAWPDRRIPPAFDTPQQTLQLDAWAYVAPPGGLHLADSASDAWPRLLTRIDPAAIWAQLGRSGLPLELRLDAGAASFDTGWPVVAMPAERHTGYAVQWFALAAALLALYLYLGIRRARENNNEHPQHDPE
ncbi:SURF1 family protein [Pseudomonas schmalbachii]|uniref:SURF1-like protein n=1 Tax=Pseudomonas schmalbachii TaxID=2816993 RepID=A0ABS3TQB4_9PSED|nr:SURF1 family protein [Pseudomonas schmalbachii]MBO3275862.1 SURF1 family protein [Pseudomonas schmalbachii]